MRGPVDVAELREMRREDVAGVRDLHNELFPVHYSDRFFEGFFAENVVALVAADAAGSVVGVGTARIVESDTGVLDVFFARKHAYIMTIGVTRAWRRRGLGTRLLVALRRSLLATGAVSRVFLHVQASNTGAMDFYLRHGFEVVRKELGYYTFGPDDRPGPGQDHCPDAFYMRALVNPNAAAAVDATRHGHPPASSECGFFARLFGWLWQQQQFSGRGRRRALCRD